MSLKKLAIGVCFVALGAINQAWAVGGESLKVDTYGIKYCAGASPVIIDPTDNLINYWIYVDSATQITVYKDAARTQKLFSLPITLTPLANTVKGDRLQYAINGMFAVSGQYIVINGSVKLDKTGTTITSTSITYIRKGLSDTCSESGRFK